MAEDRVRDTLRATRSTVDDSDGGWACCEVPRVSDMGTSRQRPASPLDRTVEVAFQVTGDQSSSKVLLDTTMNARHLNGFTNRELHVDCRSMGKLETMVLDAVAHLRLLAFAMIGVATLVACVQQPRPPVQRPEIAHQLPEPPAEVIQKAGSVLESRGIEIVSSDAAAGKVRGRASNLGDSPWAQCPSARIQDTDGNRIRIAEPQDMNLDLELDVAAAGDGSSLIIRPVFERSYLDSFRFTTFTRRCQSTGALERDLVAALSTA